VLFIGVVQSESYAAKIWHRIIRIKPTSNRTLNLKSPSKHEDAEEQVTTRDANIAEHGAKVRV